MSRGTDLVNGLVKEGVSLQAQGLSKAYQQGDTRIDVLIDASIEVATGECVAIVGPSGSGKSTLLHILAGLDTPDAGTVVVGGRTMSVTKGDERADIRAQHMGFVYQNHHLLPEFSALENVMMPLRIAREGVDSARIAAQELLEEVGLGPRLKHMPSQLSGGERQRVAVARALAGTPSVVLADEPTGNLDASNAADVMQLVKQLSSQRGVAFLVVTHDPNMFGYFDRILRLEAGHLVAHTDG